MRLAWQRIVVLGFVLGAYVPPLAAAALLDLAGAPNATTPFSARAVPVGMESVYFNPALMPWVDGAFQLGAFAFVQELDISLSARPPGVDIDASIYRARARTASGGSERLGLRPLPTAELPTARGTTDLSDRQTYVALGMVRHVLARRLSFGLYALFPLNQFQAQRPFFNDEREQYFSNSLHFERFEDRIDNAVFVFALAGRPIPQLSLGAGLTLSTASRIRNVLYVPDAADQSTAHLNAEVFIETGVVPHFAVVGQPIDNLTLSATVHLGHENRSGGRSLIRFWNYDYPDGGDAVVQEFENTYGFEPLRAAFGARYDQPETTSVGWSVSGLLTWARWSTYRDRHAERPRPGWHDTFAGAAAATLTTAGHTVGLDIAFWPSPVPPQTGRRNDVDNHRLGVATGWRMVRPVGPVRLQWGVQAQFQALLPRSVDKDPGAADPVVDEFPDAVDFLTGDPLPLSAGLQTNNPGYPGFESAGWLLGIGVQFGVEY